MTCVVEGCAKPVKVKAAGLCSSHYYRWRKHGDPLAGRVSPDRNRKCSINGCSGRGRTRGMCDMHYRRWLIHGDPSVVLAPVGPTPNRPEDLWSHVDMLGPYECWEWRDGRSPQGYGKFKMGGREYRAHRVAFQLGHGMDPGVLMVCHRCDNPPCCNPAHLFLGTALDNNRDKAQKGRAAKGEGNGRARLTSDQVREIRQRREGGETTVELAVEFGVTHTHISALARGLSWSHVA